MAGIAGCFSIELFKTETNILIIVENVLIYHTVYASVPASNIALFIYNIYFIFFWHFIDFIEWLMNLSKIIRIVCDCVTADIYIYKDCSVFWDPQMCLTLSKSDITCRDKATVQHLKTDF